jgi:hypothetical protein
MTYQLDLFVLTAGSDEKAAMDALLEHRAASLGIRTCRFEVRKHPQHDGGCLLRAPELLRTVQSQAAHALVVFDREGCGAEARAPSEIEVELEALLDQQGWERRARVVVIDPELEIWLWSDSPHVARVLGWTGDGANLREWLTAKGFLSAGAIKPARPKETMKAVLRETRVKFSAAIFADAARKVSLDRCQDPSFIRFRQILRDWFPPAF